MSDQTRQVPDPVSRLAAETWKKWRGQIAEAAPVSRGNGLNGHDGPPDAEAETWKTPEQRMVEKIRRRMGQYPEWYESDPDRLAATVCAEIDRIGATLARTLPTSRIAVDVWLIPLSVFNWLVEDGNGVRFVRGALSAWSDAQDFNAANIVGLDSGQKLNRREAFLEIAPPLLKAVLDQLMDSGIWISFGQKFTGPEFTALIMRVQCEPRDGR